MFYQVRSLVDARLNQQPFKTRIKTTPKMVVNKAGYECRPQLRQLSNKTKPRMDRMNERNTNMLY